ncbi:twin-arginine translocation signal domain-containing protein [Streptomyces sp. NPDC004542]|uniref:twin-arginine translocation signal domain-containing protein n=1 Tax=Streptomyces sp. NPDC004542 TaxID=3154281 RepID=UPI0033A7998C
MSRRSLLGYSGTAAASAAVGGAASAPPAQAQVARTETASTDFSPGTLFSGESTIGDVDAYLTIKFRVQVTDAPASHSIDPLEIAGLLNDFITERGRPAVTFSGTPPPAPLN